MNSKNYVKDIDANVRLRNSGFNSTNSIKCIECDYIGKFLGIEDTVINDLIFLKKLYLAIRYGSLLVFFLLIIPTILTYPLGETISIEIVQFIFDKFWILLMVIGFLYGFFVHNPLLSHYFIIFGERRFVVMDENFEFKKEDKVLIPFMGNLTIVCPFCGAEYMNVNVRARTIDN